MQSYKYTLSNEIVSEKELLDNATIEEVEEMIEEGELVKVAQWKDDGYFTIK
tara:strand:- start:4471 stop:4626 length:156 start_codon:yes stop_codon:yes gene_type:complete